MEQQRTLGQALQEGFHQIYFGPESGRHLEGNRVGFGKHPAEVTKGMAKEFKVGLWVGPFQSPVGYKAICSPKNTVLQGGKGRITSVGTFERASGISGTSVEFPDEKAPAESPARESRSSASIDFVIQNFHNPFPKAR